MPFQPGNQLHHTRRVKSGGRPPKSKREIKKAAAVIAREFIEEHIRPVLDNYLKLAKGYTETRYTQEGQSYEVFVPDGPTTRHFVDKILPEVNAGSLERPIAIQIVVEAAKANGANAGNGRNGHASVEIKGNGRPILIGGE